MLDAVFDVVVMAVQMVLFCVALYWGWQCLAALRLAYLARMKSEQAYASAYRNLLAHVDGNRQLADRLIQSEIAMAGERGCSPREAIRRVLRQRQVRAMFQH